MELLEQLHTGELGCGGARLIGESVGGWYTENEAGGSEVDGRHLCI